ncbi:MAG: family 16 glycoside hydrolase [Pirellulaceae bacterium]
MLLLLLFANMPSGTAQARESDYRLPILLGPQALPGRLLAGQLTRADAQVVLHGGSCLLLSEYRFGDCVLELDYQVLGPRPAAPVFYFHARLQGGTAAIDGPSVRIDPAGPPRGGGRRRSRRAVCGDDSWKHARIVVQGESASVFVDDRQVATVSCRGDRDGLLAVRVVGDSASPVALANVQVTETDFRPLFNGSDLSGWEGGGSNAALCWKVEDGLLQCTGAEGPWLRSRGQFGDFELRLEYRVREGGNSGVYVHVPADGNHRDAGGGVEVQILDDPSPRYRDLQPYQFSASLYAIAPATPQSARPAGTWNSLAILCCGDRYTISHNGEVVLDVSQTEYPELAHRLTSGFLGLQNHSETVWFRHLRIRSLP